MDMWKENAWSRSGNYVLQSEWVVPLNGLFRPCVRLVRQLGRFRELFMYRCVRLSFLPMHMHGYAWTCIHIHVACICMHMHAFACICMRMHGYACICMHMHAYAWLCMPMHAYAYIYMQMHAYACMYIYMHAYACICMHIHGYACICEHMHAYITSIGSLQGPLWICFCSAKRFHHNLCMRCCSSYAGGDQISHCYSTWSVESELLLLLRDPSVPCASYWPLCWLRAYRRPPPPARSAAYGWLMVVELLKLCGLPMSSSRWIILRTVPMGRTSLRWAHRTRANIGLKSMGTGLSSSLAMRVVSFSLRS